MTTFSESDIENAISRLADHAGAETPLLLLRLEIEFVTSVTKALVSNLVDFDRVRAEFLMRRLNELLDEVLADSSNGFGPNVGASDKPTLLLPDY